MLSKFFTYYSNEFYSNRTWTVTKAVWGFYWFFVIAVVLFQSYTPSAPSSVCKFIDCSYIQNTSVQIFIGFISFILLIMYLLEKYMKTVLLLLSIISIIIFSYQDSSGVLYRIASLSAVFIAQLIAYVLPDKKEEKHTVERNRIQFSMQVVAALYFMACFSKIEQSGLSWFLHTEGLANEVLKNWLYEYVTSTEEILFQKAYFFNELILDHPYFFSVLLLGTLIFEGGCFLSLFSLKAALFFGIGLLAMHLGIFVFMDIFIPNIVFPMLLYMLNLPAVYYSIVKLIKTKQPSPSKTRAPQSS